MDWNEIPTQINDINRIVTSFSLSLACIQPVSSSLGLPDPFLHLLPAGRSFGVFRDFNVLLTGPMVLVRVSKMWLFV